MVKSRMELVAIENGSLNALSNVEEILSEHDGLFLVNLGADPLLCTIMFGHLLLIWSTRMFKMSVLAAWSGQLAARS